MIHLDFNMKTYIFLIMSYYYHFLSTTKIPLNQKNSIQKLYLIYLFHQNDNRVFLK